MEPVDVLIVTAVPEEYAAVLAVETGAKAGHGWDKQVGSTGLEVAVREFEVVGGVLRVAVTQALWMGGASAVAAAAELIREYEVRCLAMCGVCAGRRGEVELGDVIVADRVWQYDTGKQKGDAVEGDMEMFRLHPPAWKQAAERFVVDLEAAWLAARPRTYEAQGDWILERVLRERDPVTDAESKSKCADLDKVLVRLWKKGLLADGTTELTEEGKKHIQRVLLLNRQALPEAKPFKVHVGPMASGNKVVQDERVFEPLAKSVRKVLGLEMEAAAVEMLAYMKGLPYSVVMKGVMNHADGEKIDNFKQFAARASAEVLIAFVRENVPPRGMREDPILTPGTSPLPKLAGPAALLNARHEVVPFHGREELLGEMRAWCESGDKVSARLIHAQGGMGKTRFAIELCRQMREKGWRAGFVGDTDPFGESDRAMLAVIDYAESRQDLRAMLQRAASYRSMKSLRVLLLARNADEWWADLGRSDG